METKTLTFELKSTSKAGPGEFEGTMSVPVLDRDDEIVDALCFDPLPEHITIDIDHALSVEKTVGSGAPFYTPEGILKVKGSYASTPLAQAVRTLVEERHIRHMSVTFARAVREVDEKDGKVHIRKGLLVNCTITGIPSNTSTQIENLKSLYEKVGARNAAKDLERLQATHDHMVELGATCSGKHVHDAATKTVLDDIVSAPVVDLTAYTDAPDAAATAAASGAEVERARATAQLQAALAELALD